MIAQWVMKNAASVFCRPWEKCSCYMQWKRIQEECVGFVIFSSRGKKDLRHIIHAAYLISLISSVRATAKGRFDTRIRVFLHPLPETMVLQILFEVWDIQGYFSFTVSSLWAGFGANHTNVLWRVVDYLQSCACVTEMRIIPCLPAASYPCKRKRQITLDYFYYLCLVFNLNLLFICKTYPTLDLQEVSWTHAEASQQVFMNTKRILGLFKPVSCFGVFSSCFIQLCLFFRYLIE